MAEEIQVDGDDSFGLGMDSFTLQSKLLPGEYAYSMNTINRGGLIQTRPGTSRLPLSIGFSRIPQGMAFFQPTDAVPCLVFASGGSVFYSQSPFESYTHLPNISFNENSRFISFTSCIRTTFLDGDGEIQFYDKPKNVLIMQDGATKAAYWDGQDHGHLDPLLNQTPVGLWSCWANNRLWVSRGSLVFASDIGDPTSFTESQYIAEGRAFYLPGDCTGISETPDRKGILCFTSDTATLIQSSIQDRTQWLTTKDFQLLVLPGIGCVSPRSIVQQYGMLWWMSAKGLINLDDALRSYITSRIVPKDAEMAQAKVTIDTDLSGVCGIAIENFLLHSIPVGGRENSRIMVMDQAAVENEPVNSWSSYWTGPWHIVEFAKGQIGGNECIFGMSCFMFVNSLGVSSVGSTEIWQFFRQVKQDDGIPITSFVTTKQHMFGSRDYKRFRYAEVELQNISSPTALAIGVAGIKGGYQKIAEKDLDSVIGQVYVDQSYSTSGNHFAGTLPQSRIVKTIDFPEPSECNEDCIESNERGLVDKGFSLLIIWSGIAGISSYRIFCRPEKRAYQGECETNETGENRLLNQFGCGSFGLFSISSPFPAYYSECTYLKVIPSLIGIVPQPMSFTYDAISNISQVDADRKALAIAVQAVGIALSQ